MKAKKGALAEALEGSIGAHQRFMLRQHLDLIDTYDCQLERLDEEVEARVGSFELEMTRIDEIPGLGRRTAQELIGEMGTDMSQWASERQISS